MLREKETPAALTRGRGECGDDACNDESTSRKLKRKLGNVWLESCRKPLRRRA
jgi:hypothetical protein